MIVRVALTLLVNVKSPSEAAKVLEPVLANVPKVEQFSLSVKGEDFFVDSKPKRVSRSRPVYLDREETKRIG